MASIHRAGADFVMSYASMGANHILNLLRRNDILMVAEGLDLIRVEAPQQLVGKTVKDSAVRKLTDCTIIAVKVEGETHINPNPDMLIREEAILILIGTVEAEDKFFKLFNDSEKEK